MKPAPTESSGCGSNGFLKQIVEKQRPGVALDYGMGEGRNAIYLASLGWQVWGFDPADAGVALVQKRAKELGLTFAHCRRSRQRIRFRQGTV